MAKRLFVGSLPFSATNAQLEEIFGKVGKVESVAVITDKFTGHGKGFAFVEMVTEEDAQKAVKELNGYSMDGRTIVVNEARPREDRPYQGGQGSQGGQGGQGGGQRNSNYSRPNKRW